MECAHATSLDNTEYLRRFNENVSRLRIPLSGSLEITRRCTLQCVHCYLGGQKAEHANARRELDTDHWLSLLDHIAEAGCLYLLFTGGEPMLRNDFPVIYRRAKENGMIVTLFTSGTLINDELVALLKKLPPREVEISIYGASADTHERVTGVKGSYEKCLRVMDKLLGAGLNVNLKTILMTLNVHEFEEIKSMARALGVRFRFDGAIFPCFNGDKTPISLRVPPRVVTEKEFADETWRLEWRRLYNRFKGDPVSDRFIPMRGGSYHLPH